MSKERPRIEGEPTSESQEQIDSKERPSTEELDTAENRLKAIKARIEQHRPRLRRDFDEVFASLNAKLEKENPETLSPQYLKKKHYQDYEYIFKYLRTADDSEVDWEVVVSLLNSDLQKKWSKLPKFTKPEAYENPEEVESVLKAHEDNLYTLVRIRPKSQEDKNQREIVATELINLAKKGNINAETKLVELLSLLVDRWIEFKQLPPKLAQHKDKVTERIQRSIYLYQGKGSFFSYLYANIRAMSLNLGTMEAGKDPEKSDALKKRNGKENGDVFFDEPTDEY